MQNDEFRDFLSREKKQTLTGEQRLTEGAINARISRAGRLEKELQVCLDNYMKDIYGLKQLKKLIKDSYSPNVSSTLYNSATRYYKFLHGEEPERKYKDFLKL